MYRLLIVDDEVGHRVGLTGLLRILKPEYLVFEAENGFVALSMMGVMDFDLVLTDIRMPQMDGIEFLERAKAEHPKTRVAILSAFGLFDYAKRSIALGADDYLLKPVDAEELRQCLDRMENHLQDGQSSKLQEDYVENKMYRFVTGALPAAEHNALCALFGEHDAGVVIYISQEGSWPGEEERNIFRMRLHQHLKRFGSAVIFASPAESEAMICVVACDAHTISALIQDCNSISTGELRAAGTSPVIGIGPCQGNLFSSLEDAYQRARTACMQRFFEPEKPVFVMEADQTPDPFASHRPDVSIKALDACLDAGDTAQAEQLLQEQIDRLRAFSAYPSKLKEAVMYIFIFLLGNLSNPLPQREADEFLSSINNTVLESRNLEEMWEQVRAALSGIAEAIAQRKKSQREDGFLQVLEFLSKNFEQNLSLASVAERFHYHPSYFSTLFKQNVGVTFSDHLFELRMCTAAQLLTSTKLFASKVGQRVGYPNATYFTRAFKKRFGMSPDQYRKHGRTI